MTHVYHEFFGGSDLAAHPLLVEWCVVRFAETLPRFRDGFDLIVDRVPLESCAGSLGGIQTRQGKSHELLSAWTISCY